MANRGEAATYYNLDDQNNAPKNYPMQPDQNGYNQQQYGNGNYQQQQNGQNYQQAPPNYGQNYGPQPGFGGEKPTFAEAFKIDKPKWNDLWAGILFLAVVAGFVAVSGISIQGYGK